ncbi:MAG: ABC transporter substrate-binding protein [Bifidobacteriaceae bacterium]|jgi:peptide/nickel transport system substrate-binding protein|nr:ABC transporter substrate-binding protein [Bifidobacteriaceae bacterium]
MSTLIPRKLGAAVVLTALTISVTACGQNGNSGSNASGQTGQGGDQTLTLAVPASLATLDPASEAGILNYQIAALTSDGLVGLDAQGGFVPALATEWRQEGNDWIYTIREDATFWDGSAVTIEDILYSIEVAADPEASPSTSFYWPEGVTAEQTGDHEITIHLPRVSVPFAYIPSAAGGLWVTKKEFREAAEAYGSAEDLILGTGPFKVVEFAQDSHILLERHDGYWGAKPSIQTLRIEFIPDAGTRLLAFQQGEIDQALSIPLSEVQTWAQAAGAQVRQIADRSYYGLTFDPNVEPFDDVRVRRAVAHAVDSAGIVEGVLQGYGAVAYGITAPETYAPSLGDADQALAKSKELPQVGYSIEDAKAELAASKAAGGFTTSLTYPESDQNMGKASLAIAEQLKEIGITLEVKEQPLETWVSEVGNGEQGVAWMSYTPTTGDANEITGWLLAASGPGANPANWTDQATADLIAQADQTEDPAARVDLIWQANAIAQEQVIYKPIFWGQSVTAFGSRVEAPETLDAYFYYSSWGAALSLKG